MRVFQYTAFQPDAFQSALFPVTLSDVAYTAAVDKLKRGDLVEPVALDTVVKVYKEIGCAVPFDELMTTSPPIQMTAGVSVYDISHLPINAIFSVRVRYSASGEGIRARRSHQRLYDALYKRATGMPRFYSRYGKQLDFHPVPNSSAYSFVVRHWRVPEIDSLQGNTVIVFPDPWVELVEWETLYRLYLITEQFQKAAYLVQQTMLPRQMSPKRSPVFEPGIIPRLWNDLLTTVSQKEGADEDFSINPITRPVTNV